MHARLKNPLLFLYHASGQPFGSKVAMWSNRSKAPYWPPRPNFERTFNNSIDFQWFHFHRVPKGPLSTASCSEPEEVLSQEVMLQKVPNNSPPLSRKHQLAERTPLLYNDSPSNTWLNKYHESVDTFPSSVTTYQVYYFWK